MTTLPRVIILLSSRLVPRDIRRDWTAHWLAELWTLNADAPATSRREVLAFALGAPRHAIIEALDDWTTNGIVRDARSAVARIAREPGLSLTCILIVAVAVAANAAIFSVVNATLLRTPPAVHGADRLVALLLSSVGVYALQLHATRQRRREFGIRLALGASPRSLRRRVVAAALRLTAIGVAAGLAGALLAGRGLERLLFGVGAADPVLLVLVTAVFLVIGAAAAAGPAWRAGATEPWGSSRHD